MGKISCNLSHDSDARQVAKCNGASNWDEHSLPFAY